MKAIMMKIAGISIDEVHSRMGIKPGMSADEVKKAKRAYAVKNHPDKHPGNAKKAQEFASTMGGFDDHYDGDHKRRASSGGSSSNKSGPKGAGPGRSQDPQWDGWSKDDKESWKKANGYDGSSVKGINDTKKIGHAATAASLGLSGIMGADVLRSHLQKKKLEASGHNEDAALAKSVRNRKGIGQGLGYLAGAYLGHKGYKSSRIGQALKNNMAQQHLNRVMEDQKGAGKLNRSLHAASVTGGGMMGQSVGGTIGELAAWKKNRQLNKNIKAREESEKSSK